MLQSALDVALSVMRANPTVLEGLGAHLEGDFFVSGVLLYASYYCIKVKKKTHWILSLKPRLPCNEKMAVFIYYKYFGAYV